MSKILSRRDFLKLAGSALGGAAFSPYLPPMEALSAGPLARVGTTQLSVHVQPDDTSRITGQVYRDQVLNIYEEVNSGTPGYNPIWYRVWGGYVHRARMQKVEYIFNQPAQSIREEGQLAEVTIPYTQVLRPLESKAWQPLYRLYYGTVHWVKGVEIGPDGQLWYRLLDELHDIIYDAPASHLRLIPDEELTPITPEVPYEKKRIEISLTRQVLTCYENDKVVFETTVSSGLDTGLPRANGISPSTPVGKFDIQLKMPSKHMGNGDLVADIEAYDLPGVPWTTFIKFRDRKFQGHAFHGTYWHDNFGSPMSSGCLNMRNEEAKWLFRWTTPLAAADQLDPLTLDKKGLGTTGEVFA